jgi:hypothetical protein
VFLVGGELPHPDFDGYILDNDFMLVFLEGTPTTDNDNIISVKLKSDLAVPSMGQDMTVMGWGATDAAHLSEMVMNIDVGYISNNECEATEGTVEGTEETYNHHESHNHTYPNFTSG